MKAIFPGSFNPIHNGHIEIIKYASKAYDFLYILVANNESKEYRQIIPKRGEIVLKAIKELNLKNVKVILQEPGKLTPIIAKKLNSNMIIRGSRNKILSKYEEDLSESYLDKNENLSFNYIILKNNNDISSTKIRDLLKNNKSIKGLVPNNIEKDVILLWS